MTLQIFLIDLFFYDENENNDDDGVNGNFAVKITFQNEGLVLHVSKLPRIFSVSKILLTNQLLKGDHEKNKVRHFKNSSYLF